MWERRSGAERHSKTTAPRNEKGGKKEKEKRNMKDLVVDAVEEQAQRFSAALKVVTLVTDYCESEDDVVDLLNTVGRILEGRFETGFHTSVGASVIEYK